MFLDSGNDLFYLASDFHLGAKQFFGFFHFFTGNDLTNLELHFSKILKRNLFLWFDVDHFLISFCFPGRCFFCNLRMKFFYFFHNFCKIQTCKQDFRCICYFQTILTQTKGCQIVKITLCAVDLSKDFCRCLRQVAL